jgi:hypothetical protein
MFYIKQIQRKKVKDVSSHVATKLQAEIETYVYHPNSRGGLFLCSHISGMMVY